MRQLAVIFLPLLEIATSFAALLSTKQRSELAVKEPRHKEKASTNAKSKASNIIVFLNAAPNKSILSLLVKSGLPV